MPDLTDHDILILTNDRMQSLAGRVDEALTQLQRGNERFTQIALRDQEIGAALQGLRTDYSRAMGAADGVERELRETERKLSTLQAELNTWKIRVRTIAWLLAPILTLGSALLVEIFKHTVWP